MDPASFERVVVLTIIGGVASILAGIVMYNVWVTCDVMPLQVWYVPGVGQVQITNTSAGEVNYRARGVDTHAPRSDFCWTSEQVYPSEQQ